MYWWNEHQSGYSAEHFDTGTNGRFCCGYGARWQAKRDTALDSAGVAE